MINNIRLLRSIGQFDSVNGAANIPLARLTLVYSENGRGKTTLAAVLRSLATGDPVPIAERRRLAALNPPHVVLECTGGPPPAVFENNAWNFTFPDVVVFDDVFIDENVCSGLAVQPHHRQNLHELILGAQAVRLSQQLQELVAQIETHNGALKANAAAIPAADRGSLSVDAFCELPARHDIDEAILVGERNLAAAREQDAIRDAQPMDELILPAFDVGTVERILQRDLPALDAASYARVQAHLAGLGEGGEVWVADGMRRVTQGEQRAGAGTCPFCAHDLQGSPIIQHYRAYFSDAYATLRQGVSDALESISQTHTGDMAADFERAVRVTGERRQFWSKFCEVAEVTVNTAEIVRDWAAAREAVIAQIAAKQATPLEHMVVSDETRALVATYEGHCGQLATLNQRLQEANGAIAVVKEQAAAANSTALDDDLARLLAMKARHIPETEALCTEYLQERRAKEATEQARDQAKADLEQLRTELFPGYQAAINAYLERFNTEFRLDSVTSIDTRGGPSCTYNVIINNTPVPVAGGEPMLGAPSFRNTLSSGDRNTLALAFFFASLDQDPGIGSKVVVIDDPISSLDEHRAMNTVQELRSLAERAAQVIVLSHNKPLLCRLWDGADTDVRAALEVARDAIGSTVRMWDVSEDSIEEHDRRHARFRNYLNTGVGVLRDVARCIRPHLERFLRIACPEHFPPGTGLGRFLNICEQRFGQPDEILNPAATQELREIVEYANRFHHDENAAWETEMINDGELRGFVERTLRFARP